MSTDTGAQTVVFYDSNSDHWEHHPANPRLWSSARKWQAMGIVCNFLLFVRSYNVCLPRLRSILYLCKWELPWWPPPCPRLRRDMVLLLSDHVRLIWNFISRYHKFYNFGDDVLDVFSRSGLWAVVYCTIIRDVWPHMGKINLQQSVFVSWLLI